jgi:hypothetical protein
VDVAKLMPGVKGNPGRIAFPCRPFVSKSTYDAQVLRGGGRKVGGPLALLAQTDLAAGDESELLVLVRAVVNSHP